MNRFNAFTIKTRMIVTFSFFLILLAGFGIFSIVEMSALGKLTATLYEHPLQVSKAALRASMGVIKMHRSMKDLAMSRDDMQAHGAMLAVQAEERVVYENLDVVNDLILGAEGEKLARQVKLTFSGWKPIRDEVIGLVKKGENAAAVRITQGRGADYVSRLEREMTGLTAYAGKKAENFMKTAGKTESGILRGTVIFIGLAVFFTLMAAFLMIRSILGDITRLRETMAEITSTGTLMKSDVVGRSEISEMAVHFNALIDRLQDLFRLRDGQNALNQTLSGELSYDELGEKGIRFVSRHVEACAGALYIHDPEQAVCALKASFAFVEREHLSSRFEMGEGIVGQVAVEKKPILLKNIHREAAVGATGTVNEPPRNIYALPLLHDQELLGVMEVASFEELGPLKREMLDAAGTIIAVSLHTAAQGARIKTLLEASQAANRELKQKSREISRSNEKLTALNEELQAQSRELQAQSDELRVQTSELETQRAQVEEADRLKSEFLSNMSHELRTPLNSVMALSQLMISRGTGKNPEQEKEYLRVIERNGRILLSLINDILDLSKIEAGRMDIYHTDFDPSRLVAQALETIAPMAEKKGIAVQVEAPEGLSMRCDEDKVNQILLNLFSNALKFTEAGEIRAAIRETEGTVFFRISDTGIGMEKDQLIHIFDEFRQVDGSTTRVYEGTGLGLAICRKLARLLGGEISVASEVGKGSDFTLALPLTPPEENAGSGSVSSFGAGQMAPGGTGADAPETVPATSLGETVLVVDDEPKVRSLIEDYLKASGYQVVTAKNGKEALELARRLKPFAVTLDLIMPEKDGWEVLRELKADKETKDIPVIVVSVSDDRATGLALGAAGYVMKPIDRRTLLSEIRKISTQNEVRSILLVDDDPLVLEYLENLLAHSGYDVSRASGGREGLARAAADQPDVVILDLMMPEVDGFQVLDELRENPHTRNIPVIILTARDLSGEDRLRLKSAADRIVAKGAMDREEVLHKIEEVLAGLVSERPVPHMKGGPLVLVVEDNAVAALQIREVLEEDGYAVQVASGGRDALAFVQNNIPDGIVLDLMMPGVDGFQVLGEIRSRPETAELPVLVLTAKELTAEDRARLSHNNVQQLVQKGAMDRRQLAVCVEKMLKKDKDPRPAETLETPVVEPTQHFPVELPQKAGKTILIVEDNPDNRIALTAILDDLGYPYLTAGDGREGVTAARESRPGLILMDVQLPVLSGEDAAREIKSDPSLAPIPVIALTAKAMRGDREKLLAAGCDDYLSKPIDQGQLKRLLQKWMP